MMMVMIGSVFAYSHTPVKFDTSPQKVSVSDKSKRMEVQKQLIERLTINGKADETAIQKIEMSLNNYITRFNSTYDSFEAFDAVLGSSQISRFKANEKIKIFGFIPITVTDVIEIGEKGEIIYKKVAFLRAFDYSKKK